MLQVIHRRDLQNALPNAEASYQFEGEDFGAPVSFFWTDAPPGTGPGFHQHRYAEIFVVVEGPVTFTVGGKAIEANTGQIVIAPPGVPHKFLNAGAQRSRHIDIHPSGRMNGDTLAAGMGPSVVRLVERKDLPYSANAYRFEGEILGDIPVSFFWTDEPPGAGTGIHRHPYAEVFVVQEGTVTFTLGDETVEATAGHIVMAPASVPHRFVNVGTTNSQHLDLHPSARVITEWLVEK